MDTRAKILTAEQARLRFRGGTPATLVTGYFDPLTATHIRRLAELTPPVVVLLADPPDPLLDSADRAALVAALGMVEAVVLPGPSWEEQFRSGIFPGQVVHEEDADLERRRRVIAEVHRRHREP